jgi:hypothetical protein
MFPDFVPSKSENFNVGLEVTRAWTIEKGLENSWLANNFEKNKTVDEINHDKNTHYKRLRLHMDSSNGVAFLPIDEDYKENIAMIKIAIKNKTDILNCLDGHSEVFDSNRLFIFMEYHLLKEDACDILNFMNHFLAIRHFDFIYCFNLTQLVTFNYKENSFKETFVSEEQLREIKTRANPLI